MAAPFFHTAPTLRADLRALRCPHADHPAALAASGPIRLAVLRFLAAIVDPTTFGAPPGSPGESDPDSSSADEPSAAQLAVFWDSHGLHLIEEPSADLLAAAVAAAAATAASDALHPTQPQFFPPLTVPPNARPRERAAATTFLRAAIDLSLAHDVRRRTRSHSADEAIAKPLTSPLPPATATASAASTIAPDGHVHVHIDAQSATEMSTDARADHQLSALIAARHTLFPSTTRLLAGSSALPVICATPQQSANNPAAHSTMATGAGTGTGTGTTTTTRPRSTRPPLARRPHPPNRPAELAAQRVTATVQHATAKPAPLTVTVTAAGTGTGAQRRARPPRPREHFAALQKVLRAQTADAPARKGSDANTDVGAGAGAEHGVKKGACDEDALAEIDVAALAASAARIAAAARSLRDDGGGAGGGGGEYADGRVGCRVGRDEAMIARCADVFPAAADAHASLVRSVQLLGRARDAADGLQRAERGLRGLRDADAVRAVVRSRVRIEGQM